MPSYSMVCLPGTCSPLPVTRFTILLQYQHFWFQQLVCPILSSLLCLAANWWPVWGLSQRDPLNSAPGQLQPQGWTILYRYVTSSLNTYFITVSPVCKSEATRTRCITAKTTPSPCGHTRLPVKSHWQTHLWGVGSALHPERLTSPYSSNIYWYHFWNVILIYVKRQLLTEVVFLHFSTDLVHGTDWLSKVSVTHSVLAKNCCSQVLPKSQKGKSNSPNNVFFFFPMWCLVSVSVKAQSFQWCWNGGDM